MLGTSRRCADDFNVNILCLEMSVNQQLSSLSHIYLYSSINLVERIINILRYTVIVYCLMVTLSRVEVMVVKNVNINI